MCIRTARLVPCWSLPSYAVNASLILRATARCALRSCVRLWDRTTSLRANLLVSSCCSVPTVHHTFTTTVYASLTICATWQQLVLLRATRKPPCFTPPLMTKEPQNRIASIVRLLLNSSLTRVVPKQTSLEKAQQNPLPSMKSVAQTYAWAA